MNETPQDVNEVQKDTFERVRETLWGAPGFQHRNSTILASSLSFLPQGTWIVETVRTDDSLAIFLQRIDKDGGQRIILPRKVCEIIYKHRDSIMKIRRSVRAQHGAETKKKKRE